jgi:hypothetical protein
MQKRERERERKEREGERWRNWRIRKCHNVRKNSEILLRIRKYKYILAGGDFKEYCNCMPKSSPRNCETKIKRQKVKEVKNGQKKKEREREKSRSQRVR